MSGVDALSPTDIWAVGRYGSGPRSETLTLHWNGVQWSFVYSPSPGNASNAFNYVDALTANDVWAVGYSYSTGNGWRTLIEHWNGTQWIIVPSPNPDIAQNYLLGVSAISDNDVWAVGYYSSDSGLRTLAVHWDGTQWSVVATPQLGSRLFSVSAIATNDVWAVGFGSDGALIEHWNGTQWTIVQNPNPPGTNASKLEGVRAISSNDVWAVGTWGDGHINHTLTKHWDGTQWSWVPSPDVVQETNWLYDVSAVSSTDVWAVGYFCCTSMSGMLAMHWDGATWTIVPSPNPSSSNNYTSAIAAIAGGDVWAVGQYDGTTTWRALIEHYTLLGTCITPTPTITSTPTPSITPTFSATATITTTPTPIPQRKLIGHVDWEARPLQPSQLQQLPLTLTLRLNTIEESYSITTTDRYGFFTVPLGSLPTGTYTWRADDSTSAEHSPNYLANSGVVGIIAGIETTQVTMGLMKVGDADNNNLVNISDFNILKVSFGSGCGNGAYDRRTDFSGDCLINIYDFTPLKRNFGRGGAQVDGP